MQPFRIYDAHTLYSNTAKVMQQLCKGYTASLQKLYTTTAKAMQ